MQIIKSGRYILLSFPKASIHSTFSKKMIDEPKKTIISPEIKKVPPAFFNIPPAF